MSPEVILSGKTVARRREYVGLQLLKTGQRADQIAIGHHIHDFSFACWSEFCDQCSMPVFVTNQDHIFGNVSVLPNMIKIPPEIYSHTFGSISMRSVEALSSRVNSINEIIKDTMII